MGAMLSLADVCPRYERVSLGDGEIEVYGLSAEDLGKLLIRFPNAFEELYTRNLLGMNPEMVGAVMAASQRNGKGSYLGDESVEMRSRYLSIGDQMRVMKALARCTFPDCVGPFLEDLAQMSSSTGAAIDVIVKVGSKEHGTTSPPMPKPSAPPEVQPSGS